MVAGIREVLMKRDRMSVEEADDLIAQARTDLHERLGVGDGDNGVFDICEEWFGLEPDYLDELMC